MSNCKHDTVRIMDLTVRRTVIRAIAHVVDGRCVDCNHAVPVELMVQVEDPVRKAAALSRQKLDDELLK